MMSNPTASAGDSTAQKPIPAVAGWRRVLRGSSGNVLMIMLGSGIGQSFVLLVSPFLTRIYNVEQFGLLTVFISITSILGTFALFRFDAAIPLPSSNRMAASVAWLALSTAAVTSLVVGLLGPLVAPPLGRLINSPDLASVWWLVVAAMLMVAVDQVLLTWMVRSNAIARWPPAMRCRASGRLPARSPSAWPECTRLAY